MRFLFHSKEGDSFSLARRVSLEGHEAEVFIESPKHKRMGDGLINKVDDLDLALASIPDIVVFDREGNGEFAEEIRRDGIPVVGAGEFADYIELDRIAGIEFASTCGILLPDTFIGSHDASKRKRMIKAEGVVAVGEDFDDARQFIKDDGRAWVFKPCGNKGTATTYVSHGPEDMIYMLNRMEKLVGENCEFVLQLKVDGHEISSEGWYAGDHWLSGTENFTIEDKKFLHGDLGPNCGCAGNVVFSADIKGCLGLIRKHVYDKIGAGLSGKGFYGPLDLNAIWTDRGPYFLEFTPRFGYDAIQTWLQILQSPLADALYDCGTGGNRKVYCDRHVPAVGVRLSIPPYPHGEDNAPGELLLEGLDENDPSIHLSDVKKTPDKHLVTAGADGNICTVTAVGVSLEEALASCYSKIHRISIPDVQYRLDVGQRAGSVLAFLEALANIASGDSPGRSAAGLPVPTRTSRG
jgi:phosphoribosylamine-glycine ligase